MLETLLNATVAVGISIPVLVFCCGVKKLCKKNPKFNCSEEGRKNDRS